MSPRETSAEFANRVRCFAKNALVEPIAKQKWDLIQVFCIQPYNRHVQYGISFIKINGITEGAETKPKPLVPASFLNAVSSSSPFSQFKMREESSDSDNESVSLFSRWKQDKAKGAAESPLSGMPL